MPVKRASTTPEATPEAVIESIQDSGLELVAPPSCDALPNLAGVVTENLVETIGTGKYAARYLNWSRTLQLIRSHAPGWMAEVVPSADGGLVHPATSIGGYLLIRFVHLDGRKTPVVPQAIMDNRNAAIPIEKITARDITDTHRRGVCLAAAFFFGLAYELWAKQPLESGFASIIESEDGAPAAPISPATTKALTPATAEQFLEAALQIGLSTYAAEYLVEKVKSSEATFASAIQSLAKREKAWVEGQNKLAEARRESEAESPKPSAEQF